MSAWVKPWIGGPAKADRPLFLRVILGTNRKGRVSESVARYVLNELKKRSEVTTTLIDVATYDFPSDDYGTSIKGMFPEFVSTVSQADGLIIVSPEYNRGYSGKLKMLLDMLYPEYFHKAVGVVSVSSGPWGGVRMTDSMLPVLRELGLVISRVDLQFPNASDAFDTDGKPRDKSYAERSDKFFKELFWLAKAMRWGRGNL